MVTHRMGRNLLTGKINDLEDDGSTRSTRFGEIGGPEWSYNQFTTGEWLDIQNREKAGRSLRWLTDWGHGKKSRPGSGGFSECGDTHKLQP
jgi:hypothetical protein